MTMPCFFEMIFFEALIGPMNYSAYSDRFNRLGSPAGHRRRSGPGHRAGEALLDTATICVASRTIAIGRAGG
jgi:hypothetical protein